MKKILTAFAILILFFLGAPSAEAANASLFLSPSSGTFTIGSNFSVSVKVNSGGAIINAAEGNLVFDSTELNVVSISKSGSIFTLWTTEPTFSNSSGKISFGGGTPNNFIGESGTIITITFKVQNSASSQVGFSSGSVLAADGMGTNVLANLSGGVYTLTPRIVTPPEEEITPPVTPGTPAAPVISSATHPNSNKWYSNNDPEFSWEVPGDVTALRLLLDESAVALPNVPYSPPISEKKIEDVADGIWYFSARFKNDYGWGGVARRKVLIDTEAPEVFEIRVDSGGDPTNPSPILIFDTTDSLSGIEYYEVKVGDKDAVPVTATALKSNPYVLSPQMFGEHTLIVRAVDAAGNSTLASTDIAIEPLETPTITDLPLTIQTGEALTVKGISLYPDAKVKVYVQKEGEEVIEGETKTDKEGNWSFVYEKSLESGTYQVWAELIDARGARSNLTDKVTVAATLPFVLKFGKIAIDYLTVMTTSAVLIIFLVLIIFYAWYRISLWRKRMRKETKEVAQSVAAAFRALREEIEEQIEDLDKKPGLTRGEKAIRDKLQKALNTSEKFIGKEIRDIEKELE